jgi:hypothetical protein
VLDDQAQPFDMKQIDTAHIDTRTSDVKHQHGKYSLYTHNDTNSHQSFVDKKKLCYKCAKKK